MANVYKRTAVSTSAGGITLATTGTEIIPAIPASTAGLVKSVRCTNGTANTVTISAFIRDSTGVYEFMLADEISIPANASLNLVDSTVVLDVGDSMRVFGSVVTIEVAAYWLETDN